MEVLLLPVLIIAFICAGLSSHVADAKGCDSVSWGLVGLLCGPLALLALAAMPDRRLRRYIRALAEKSDVELDSLGSEQPSDNPKNNTKTSKDDFQTWPNDSPKSVWRLFIKAVASNSIIDSERISLEHSDLEALNIVARDKNGNTVVEAIGNKGSEFGSTYGSTYWKLQYPTEQS